MLGYYLSDKKTKPTAASCTAILSSSEKRYAQSVRFHFFLFVYLISFQANKGKTKSGRNLDGWQVGKTKVFLKYWHLDILVSLIEPFESSATIIQVITSTVPCLAHVYDRKMCAAFSCEESTSRFSYEKFTLFHAMVIALSQAKMRQEERDCAAFLFEMSNQNKRVRGLLEVRCAL